MLWAVVLGDDMTEEEFQEKMNLLNQWLMSGKEGDVVLADELLKELLGDGPQNDYPTGSGPTAAVEG